jgi:hemolysin activation/secretion protein
MVGLVSTPAMAAALVKESVQEKELSLTTEVDGAIAPSATPATPIKQHTRDVRFPFVRSERANNPLQVAQVPSDFPADLPTDLQRPEPPLPQQPLPQTPLSPLPPPDQLLPQTGAPTVPPESQDELLATIRVDRFEVVGSTVFSPEELAEMTAPSLNRDLTFAELLQVRTAITQQYVDRGYITSGAFIPAQTPVEGVVRIQVIEGSVEEINITGNRRLNSAYVRSRLRLASEAPLNVNQLLEGLQLLQLNPLIENISADLQSGVRPGTSLLQVEVQEARTFRLTPSIDNGQSPSVGSFRRRVELSEANLFGWGDGISLNYSNTAGSNGIDIAYTLPINPRNGTVRFGFGTTTNNVLEAPFDVLDIQAVSRYYELNFIGN